MRADPHKARRMSSPRPVDVIAERRARLAAERLQAMQERRLRAEAERLERLSRGLSARIAEKRDEIDRLTREAEALRRDNRALTEGAARREAEIQAGERTVWSALQTLRDGFAIFDADRRLVVANHAYLSIFDGLEEMRAGIPSRRVAELLWEEGIIDPAPHGAGWVDHMAARWDADPIPPELLRLWNGQVVKLIDRHLPDGGVVTLAVNQTAMLRVLSAIEAIPDGFVLFDRDDRLVMCNQSYRDLFPGDAAAAIVPGVSYAEILRGGLARGQYPEAAGREEDWIEERLEHRAAPDGAAFEQQMSDGRWLRVLERETPDGGRAGLRIDITALKRQQQELCRLHETAAAGIRAKSAFLSNMSHEIRTPVNGIVGMAELLLDGPLDEGQRDDAATLRASATALLTLVDDVLDFSRSESGLMSLAPAPFDPARLVGGVVASFAAAARQKGLAIRLDGGADLPARLLGDARRIRQIVTNLVANAVKFTEAGHVALAVRAAPAGPGRVRLTVEVADTGPGIAPEAAPHLFAGFAPAERGPDRPHDGAGLGLAICRRLTDLMAGEIAHAPRPGGGSVFTLSLDLPSAEAERPDTSPAGPAAPCAAAPLAVLAAEDNRTNRLVLEKLLAPLGIELTLASNGAEAVAAVTAAPPDLVLMDISMPDMDGCEAARRIRAWERETGRPPVSIVAMTAHALPDDIARIRAAGIDEVLTKPLSRAALAERIEAVRQAAAAAASER